MLFIWNETVKAQNQTAQKAQESRGNRAEYDIIEKSGAEVRVWHIYREKTGSK
jgi:hypothetical protein